MTRKDYIATARILKDARFESAAERERTVDLFCTMFALDNPSFDKARFVSAATPREA